LAQVILGASHLAQVAIPALLLTPPSPPCDINESVQVGNAQNPVVMNSTTTEYRKSYDELMEWKNSVRNTIYEQSRILCIALQRIGPCLHVIEPQGAMYAMVQINLEYFDATAIRNDIDFTTLLYQEENVVVLPGTCFDFPNSFRVVCCAPVPILQEAAHRIHLFCHRHVKRQ
jgi:tyrosine aminotransferase